MVNSCFMEYFPAAFGFIFHLGPRSTKAACAPGDPRYNGLPAQARCRRMFWHCLWYPAGHFNFLQANPG
jgi:hypothetical protein